MSTDCTTRSRMVGRATFPTVQATIMARLALCSADTYLAIADYFFTLGTGECPKRPAGPLGELLDALRERFDEESERMAGLHTRTYPDDAPLPFDNTPLWLQAAAERQDLLTAPLRGEFSGPVVACGIAPLPPYIGHREAHNAE